LKGPQPTGPGWRRPRELAGAAVAHLEATLAEVAFQRVEVREVVARALRVISERAQYVNRVPKAPLAVSLAVTN